MKSSNGTNGQRIDETATEMGENVVNLAQDLVSLAELQAKLLMLDVQEGGLQAQKPAAILLAGAAFALGTIPVLLLGLGGLLSHWTSLSQPLCLLIVSLTVMGLSGYLFWMSTRELRKATLILLRSRTEFRENIDWIKRVIQQTSMGSSR